MQTENVPFLMFTLPWVTDSSGTIRQQAFASFRTTALVGAVTVADLWISLLLRAIPKKFAQRSPI